MYSKRGKTLEEMANHHKSILLSTVGYRKSAAAQEELCFQCRWITYTEGGLSKMHNRGIISGLSVE